MDSEQSSFFGLTHEVNISPSSIELMEQLTDEVFDRSRGDRRVRRYFDAYDTPFIGSGRRTNYNSSYYD
ncbi:unnamed protein product [Danaus chrysippus]|uniref:(African queen) hypothetical protein n=1 Tax=Danaus chrysippus TaxID=151541 RepID=A0A8J2R6M8_9NEOP|nr:unnamed protein product [Danaus chrysippus]